jgi:predicted thioesterase
MEEQKIKDARIVEQIVDDMDLFDDDLMSMVFDGNIEATELLLKVILEHDDVTVVSVVGQREFQNPIVGGRNIRLDILAKDSTGKNYNVEVQKKPEGAHIRRARFNSSMLDSRMLKAGQEFAELQDSYMVFITETDIFGHGLPIYTINRHFEEIEDLFDDGSHIIYVNGSYKGDDPIGRMMHDFGCKESKDIYYPELAKGVKHFKEEGGRKIMCEAVERYAENSRIDERSETIKHMLEKGKSSEEIADLCGYDLKFVRQVEESMAQTV